ncbi:MAG: hypothetical protein R3E08_03960 [Thiotrichaceae bacterium]
MPELLGKAAQLFAELEHLRFTREIDGFTLARLQKETRHLLKTDALHAYQILGALEGFAGNIVEMRQNYEAALHLTLDSLNKSIVLHNYATSLVNVGYFSESIALEIKSRSLVEMTESRLLSLVKVHVNAGLFHRAAQYLEKAADFDNELSVFVLSLTQFMDENGVCDEELQQMIEIAIAVLHRHQFFNFYSGNVTMNFAGDEGARWFRYVIKVNRSVEEVVEMKYELACQLAETDLPLKLLNNFMTTYECVGE